MANDVLVYCNCMDRVRHHVSVADSVFVCRSTPDTAGHAEPGTTKLYDRRGYNPEKSASFFATY